MNLSRTTPSQFQLANSAKQTLRESPCGDAERRGAVVMIFRVLIPHTDLEHDVHFDFLTNNFHLVASTIARLYHCCWEVELLFKWIKQHLRIKSFFRTSPNAVKTQLWIAVSVYELDRQKVSP